MTAAPHPEPFRHPAQVPDPNAPLAAVPGPPVVRAEADSRLDQLVALFDQLDAEAKAAAARLDETKKAIKTELANRHPEAEEVLLVAPSLRTPLRFYAQTKWTIDSKALKAKDPVTWVRWAKESTVWYLARSK